MQSNDLERLSHIPDVTLRLGRGEEDAPAYVTLLHACQSIDGIDVFSTLESLPTPLSPRLVSRRNLWYC